ncbi:MAG: hypothetical protein EPN70_24510 [Paraburkholderia sp.]|uniref:hypothetical protein n=1 Tax=Paraburkholderia sp. TaxID=1926495 RepID=UPI0011FF9430|nr:hypothetical protein [Paraburkholderia sp.]TAL99691.1 MAG: hypothetical protein EPN70_24510 [Paraburkholderia sp.]
MSKKYALGLAAVALCFSGCAPIMEANRPNPVDLDRFVVGQTTRINVIAQVGGPTATEQDQGNSCDVYKLYTHGPGGAGKGAIAAGEAVADVFTLGLAEIIFTPTEAATKNAKHTVLFCYGSDGKLASVRESDAASGS